MSREQTGAEIRLRETEAQMERVREAGALVERRNAELNRKVSRYKRYFTYAAIPWLVLTAPISLPVALAVIYAKKRRARASSTPLDMAHVAGERTSGPSDPQCAGEHVVQRAYFLLETDGPEAAQACLRRAGKRTPAGARPILATVTAGSDAEWKAAFDAWCDSEDLPRPDLEAADGRSRFARLRFAAADPVEAPCKISVIMPCHNCEDTVRQAIGSILGQTWRNLEVIAIDDHSDDRTYDVLRALAREDGRLLVLRNPVNVGPYVTKNRALDLCSGDYVTGHDSDDIALPDRLEQQVKPLLEAGYVASLGSMVRLDEDGRFTRPGRVGQLSKDGISRQAFISLMVHLDFFRKFIGHWDGVRYGADAEMISRVEVLLGEDLVRLSRPVMICLDAPGGLTNRAESRIDPRGGLSTTRSQYRDAWRAWHQSRRLYALHLDAVHAPRRFPAPAEMLVSAGDIEAVNGDPADAHG